MSSRRFFLRGLGVAGLTVALPGLESLVRKQPASVGSVRAAATASKKLFLFHWGNGRDARQWYTTQNDGGLFQPGSSPMLSLFGELGLAQDVSLVSGLSNETVVRGGPHGRPAVCFLTSTNPIGNEDVSAEPGGISVDQLIANRITGSNLYARKSVVIVSTEGNNEHSTYNNVSFVGPGLTNTTPRVLSPAVLFSQLYSVANPDDAERLAKEQASLLDHVNESIAEVERQCSSCDKERLDQYLTSFREYETAVKSQRFCGVPTNWQADAQAMPIHRQSGFSFANWTRLMLDMSTTALQCELTPVVCFSLVSGENNGMNWNETLGINFVDHEVSHLVSAAGTDNKDPDADAPKERNRQVVRWKLTQYATLLQMLKSKTMADGSTLWDNTLAVGASELGDAMNHRTEDLPVLLSGGPFHVGKHLTFSTKNELANLWLTVIRGMGIGEQDVPSFGVSQGVLEGALK